MLSLENTGADNIVQVYKHSSLWMDLKIWYPQRQCYDAAFARHLWTLNECKLVRNRQNIRLPNWTEPSIYHNANQKGYKLYVVLGGKYMVMHKLRLTWSCSAIVNG